MSSVRIIRRLRLFRSKAQTASRSARIALLRRLPLNPRTVVYESFAGNGAVCNPEAIFRRLLARADMTHLRHVWVLDDPSRHRALLNEFRSEPRVSVVRAHSAGYDRALATAGYLVNNATFPYRFARRAGQVYLNTWHGTPLKAMGYDVPGGALATRNVVRNIASSDYLLAPNDATERMFLDAYRGRNLFTGRIIREGTPRIDKQFVGESGKAAIRERLRAGGVDLDPDQRILLYAPTWRGDFYRPDDDIERVRADVDRLQKQVAPARYTVLVKLHQQVVRFAGGDPGLRARLVPHEVPANDVLAVTDVLVTDYSSIFVDFLATGRPVLFYCPDVEQYQRTRGFNAPQPEWPGPVVQDIDDLAELVLRIGSGDEDDPLLTHGARYAAARDRWCSREDGHATDRVIDIVFRGATDGYDVHRAEPDGRRSVLIYLGGMLPNGITMSALNLLRNIDHDRLDVTAFFPYVARGDKARLIARIDPRVRLVPRCGPMSALPWDIRAIKVGEGWGTARSHRRAAIRRRRALQDEWVRCFGSARFDHIVDFSGYGPFWAKILLQGVPDSGARRRPHGAPANSRPPSLSIWLHNDLKSDAGRRVNGSTPHRDNLYGMFDLYHRADALVSVSSALSDVNSASLATFAGDARFTFARNAIDHERIREMAAGHDEDRGRRAVVMESRLWRSPDVRVFVTVGRLSPEKNHERLIRAFDIVHREDPRTALVIIGTGPLKGALRRIVAECGLGSSVLLAGQRDNPYTLMAQTDCFVLSSDYEGQPMVILEALVLGLPVVSTAFASVADALPSGSGLVVERSVGALAEGMRSFLRGEVPHAPFDAAAYNASVIGEFEAAIGVRQG